MTAALAFLLVSFSLSEQKKQLGLGSHSPIYFENLLWTEIEQFQQVTERTFFLMCRSGQIETCKIRNTLMVRNHQKKHAVRIKHKDT